MSEDSHPVKFESTAPRWIAPRSAYIHIPFCAHHCGYCDFAVTAGNDHLIDLYLEALEAEIGSFPCLPLRTLFLGGGTPSHLSLSQLTRLFDVLRRLFSRESDAEVSLEANPDSFGAEKARLLAELGVTRISLGVQSFEPAHLATLERRHNPSHIIPAVEAAQRFIGRVSVDLIFGIPGQTLNQWINDLDRSIALQPEQVSTYGLTFEKGTRLFKQKLQGMVKPVEEDLEGQMYREAMDRLESAGFRQYEISSFARPGAECRHNQMYWANEAFFGFGVGAAAYVAGRRTLNVRNTPEYIRRALANEPTWFQAETLEPEARARETLTLNLRRVEGIERTRYCEQTGYRLDELAAEPIRNFTELGLLADNGSSVALTREGRCVADSVVSAML